MAVPGSGWPGPNAETNTQRAFVILLGFIHIFLIAVVIGSVEGFMSHLNHNAEQLRLRIMHLNRCVGYAGDGESTGEGLGVGLGGGASLRKPIAASPPSLHYAASWCSGAYPGTCKNESEKYVPLAVAAESGHGNGIDRLICRRRSALFPALPVVLLSPLVPQGSL
jgi:hypothetical protein